MLKTNGVSKIKKEEERSQLGRTVSTIRPASVIVVKDECSYARVKQLKSSESTKMFCDQPLTYLYGSNTKIFLDGNWICSTPNHVSFLGSLRSLRRSGSISHQISISYKPADNEIHIWTDSGRCMRPLLVVDNN